MNIAKKITAAMLAMTFCLSAVSCGSDLGDEELRHIQKRVFRELQKSSYSVAKKYSKQYISQKKCPLSNKEQCDYEFYGIDSSIVFERDEINKNTASIYLDGGSFGDNVEYSFNLDSKTATDYFSGSSSSRSQVSQILNDVSQMLECENDPAVEWETIELESDDDLKFEVTINLSEDAVKRRSDDSDDSDNLDYLHDYDSDYIGCTIKGLTNKDGDELGAIWIETEKNESIYYEINQTYLNTTQIALGSKDVLEEHFDFPSKNEIKEMYKSIDSTADI